jgi:hypothetical protein
VFCDAYEDPSLTSSFQQDGRLLEVPADRRETRGGGVPKKAEVGWSNEAYITFLGIDLDVLLDSEDDEWD